MARAGRRFLEEVWKRAAREMVAVVPEASRIDVDVDEYGIYGLDAWLVKRDNACVVTIGYGYPLSDVVRDAVERELGVKARESESGYRTEPMDCLKAAKLLAALLALKDELKKVDPAKLDARAHTLLWSRVSVK